MARQPDPGSLDQRIAIDLRVETRSSATGEVVVSWSEVTEVWARVEPLSVREFLASESTQDQATHRVTIRNRADLTPKHRLRWGDLPMNIVGPLDAGQREPYLHLLCTMGPTDGR